MIKPHIYNNIIIQPVNYKWQGKCIHLTKDEIDVIIWLGYHLA
jgi:hypothetical protein